MTVTSDNGQNAAFITFTAATRTVAWLAPTVAGIYTALITGKITNAGT